MIKRIIILLKRFYSKMSVSLYMLRCPNRSYSARCTVILVTSRDCNHITWFRNSVSVSLLATKKSFFSFLKHRQNARSLNQSYSRRKDKFSSRTRSSFLCFRLNSINQLTSFHSLQYFQQQKQTHQASSQFHQSRFLAL
jgi:hypothetical protein